jgi:hypothetical protein
MNFLEHIIKLKIEVLKQKRKHVTLRNRKPYIHGQ